MKMLRVLGLAGLSFILGNILVFPATAVCTFFGASAELRNGQALVFILATWMIFIMLFDPPKVVVSSFVEESWRIAGSLACIALGAGTALWLFDGVRLWGRWFVSHFA